MAKRNGSNIVEEAHERSRHNINPLYWFNKVNRFRLSQMRASLGFAWLDFLLLIIWLAVIVPLIVGRIREDGWSIWKDLLSDVTGIIGLLVFTAVTIVVVLRFMKWVSLSRQKSQLENVHRSRQRKKKYPKHRKDYK